MFKERERRLRCVQLEAANRQLRSTRQFVEEQAAEREAERDDFARRVADLRADNARLAARLHASARVLAEVLHICIADVIGDMDLHSRATLRNAVQCVNSPMSMCYVYSSTLDLLRIDCHGDRVWHYD